MSQAGEPFEQTDVPEVSHVARRAIQAPVVVTLIKAYAEELGFEKAIEVARRAIEQDARADAEAAGRKYGRDLEGLARVIREVWCQGAGMEIEFTEESPRALSFNVLQCGYAAMYDKLGLKEFGSCLSCSRDAVFAEAFAPDIRLTRTKTIMEGATHCDFRYTRDG